jgi:hypothetical protein
MTSRLRTLACVLLLVAGSRQLHAAPGTPASVSADSTALEFHGFRAGARLDELNTLIREMDGSRLRCDRSKTDTRVTECRATLSSEELGGPVHVWVSAIDSVAGVIMLSGEVAADQLDRWRGAVERRYGRVGAKVQGGQWMMQWVRRGRMLRLTWRIERGEKVASLSLVDGRVLDAWGRSRRHGSPS